MESQLLGTVIGVLSIFVGIPLAIMVLILILRKLKISNSVYSFAFSIGGGLIFSLGSMGLILLSKKFNDWTFVDKLIYAGKFFPLVSLLIFISMEFISQKINKENR